MPEISTRTITYFPDVQADSIEVRQKFLEEYSGLQLGSSGGGGDLCNPYRFKYRRAIAFLRIAKDGYDTDRISKGRGATKVAILIPATASIETAYSNASARSDFICMDYIGEYWSSLPLFDINPQRGSSGVSERIAGTYEYTMDGTGRKARVPVSTEIFPTSSANYMKALPGFSEDSYCNTGHNGRLHPRHLMVKWNKAGGKNSGTITRKLHIARPGDIESAIQFAASLSPACISYVGERVINWSPG